MTKLNQVSSMEQCLGFAYRPTYNELLLTGVADVACLEIMFDDCISSGLRLSALPEPLSALYHYFFHAVAMNIASSDPINCHYLNLIKALTADWLPALIMSHLCWTGVGRRYSHDLLPFPFNPASLRSVINRVQQVQDCLGCQFVLENITRYIAFHESTLSEIDCWRELIYKTECEIFLDVNNLYVNVKNLGFEPFLFLRALPEGSVKQYQMATHQDKSDFLSSSWVIEQLSHLKKYHNDREALCH